MPGRWLRPFVTLLLALTSCDGAILGVRDAGLDGGGVCTPGTATLDVLYDRYFDARQPTGCAAAGCHGTGAGSLTFRSASELYAATVGVATTNNPNLQRVRAGDPASSALYARLLPQAPGRMPSGGPYLDDQALAELAGWICAGAPAPTPSDAGSDAGLDAGSPDAGGPQLLSFDPTSGVVGTPVTLTGSGFSTLPTENLVTFNGVAASVSSASATRLVTAVPATAQTGRITVTVGGLTATAPADFQVITTNPAPTLTSISPATVAPGGADLALSLVGTGFVSTSTAALDGTSLATTFQSATSLRATIPAASLASAGQHTVTVTSPGPGGGTSIGQSLSVANPAPTIASLSPAQVLVGSGGFSLTINGTGFVAASTVTIDGAPATATLVSASQLTVAVASSLTSTTGTHSVLVTNAAPGGGSSAPSTLTVGNPLPVLSSVLPATVSAGSGATAVTLSGSGFVTTSQVEIDGAALPTAYVSATQLTASVSAALTAVGGAHLLRVVNAGPGGGASATQSFAINNPAPSLASISPASVSTNGAPFTLSLTGSGFTSGSAVSFNGAAVPTTFVSATSLQAQLPTLSAPGTFPVTVTNPAPGGGTSAALSLTASVSNAPSITGLSPGSAATGAAFTLVVTGSGYVCGPQPNPSQVLFGGATLTPSACSSTQLTVSVGAQAAGTYPVQVRNPAGGVTSNTMNFPVVVPNPVPTLAALSPSSAAPGGAAFTLSLSGSGFVNGAVVNFNGNARSTTFVSASQVTAAILASDLATAGAWPVTVTTPAPGGGASNALAFTVISNNPVPTISGLSPATVGAGSGAVTVTLTGTGFLSASSAALNGSARPTTFLSATQLTVALTAADTQSAGANTLTVTNPAPGGGTSNAYTLSVVTQNPVPVLSSLSPTSATASGAGFTLTVNGSGFINGSTVSFNGVAKSTTYVSASQLTAAISSADVASAGSVPVVVTTPTPGGGTSAALTFAVNNPAPNLSSLSPATVSVGSGAFSLTVGGAGFTSSSTVLVDGAARTTHFVSSAQLTADLLSSDDSATGTHSITVLNPTPGGGTSAPLTLTVSAAANPVPTVSSLLPCGTVAGSAQLTLTITGTGFVSGATATFRGTPVAVNFVSATQLTATIPASVLATAPTGNFTQVLVSNPSPGGGPANTVTFGIASAAVTLSSLQTSIFTPVCSSCHPAQSPNLSAGASWSSLVGVACGQCATPRLYVKACAPQDTQSYLVAKIQGTNMCSGTQMPKAGMGAPTALTAAQQQSILNWIAAGALNN